MNTSTDLKAVKPWKVWTGPEKFSVARREASKQGFNFFGSESSSYDERGFPALYGDVDDSLAYSSPESLDFFRVDTSTEVFLWSDGTLQLTPEVKIPTVESLTFGASDLPTRRAWLQARLSAVAGAISAQALNDENVPYEYVRELSDLVSMIRKL